MLLQNVTARKACLTSMADAITCAERIGYPVMLKASEGATTCLFMKDRVSKRALGGGGKGIRMSNSKEELEQHFSQVQ